MYILIHLRCVADNKVSENGTCVTPIPPATINLNVTLRCRLPGLYASYTTIP